MEVCLWSVLVCPLARSHVIRIHVCILGHFGAELVGYLLSPMFLFYYTFFIFLFLARVENKGDGYMNWLMIKEEGVD